MSRFPIAAFLATAALVAGPARSGGVLRTYYDGPAAPIGTLRVSRPVIGWKVWADGGDARIAPEVSLTVNGRRVPATYIHERRAVVYEPPRPLAPGAYDVRCQVNLGGEKDLRRAWKFTVAPGATDDLPAPDAAQQVAWTVANGLRRKAGLDPLRLNTRLSAAATAHSRFLHRNRLTGHYEVSTLPGFTGFVPWDRTAAFGYFGGVAEDAEYGSPTVARAVTSLFHAPYHRLPFLQPGAPDFGAGRVERHTTLEFGRTDEVATVVSPADGQRDVPTAWDGNENPAPLRLHRGARAPVGYVIVFAHFTPERAPIRVTSATLTDQSGAVPLFLNTPENDRELSYAAFLIPKRPLKPLTAYRVSVRAFTESGQDISRTWVFTTGEATRPR